ncbi:MAG TPA: hypothetical protein VGJ84_23420, partial [Polyangiaceae bacterium]
ADPLLTSLFALIEPIIIQKRGSTLDDLGYDSSHVIDCANHASILCQSLAYSASVFGMTMPPAYENTNDPGGLLFLHAHEPSVVLGVAALGAQLGSQPATFIAARHLAYLRPSLYTRQLIPTIAGLKAWLFASVKLIAPQFPIAAELEGPVREALEALDRGLAGHSRDHLARVVAKLVQSGASLDLKKWIAGVDFTADRAGFVLCHDLEISLELIKASEEGSTAASNQERNKELVLFSVSEPYFALRKKLGVAID